MVDFLQLSGDSRQLAASQMAVLGEMAAHFLLLSLPKSSQAFVTPQCLHRSQRTQCHLHEELLYRSSKPVIGKNQASSYLCTGAGFHTKAASAGHPRLHQTYCVYEVGLLQERAKATLDSSRQKTFSIVKLEETD